MHRAAKRCVTCFLQPKRKRTGADSEDSPSTLPLTAAWMLQPNHWQGRNTLGQVLREMCISTANLKKQALQSIAGAFPGNSVLHKWHIVSSSVCTLCG